MFHQARSTGEDPCLRSDRGREGEEQAVAYFQKQGYALLARNFRTPLGEIDAVFQKGEAVVFVEVKLRGGFQIASPEESVTRAQQKRLVKTALQFVKARRLRERQFRFDVVIVSGDGLRHIENAFSGLRRYTF